MATEIYLVMETNDEGFSFPTHAWNTRLAAEQNIERLTADDFLHNQFVDIARDFEKQWLVNNPEPVFPAHLLKKKVRWRAGLRREEITPEMRQARQDVEDHNNKIMDEFHTAHGIHFGLLRQALVEHLQTIPDSEKYLKTQEEWGYYGSKRFGTYHIKAVLLG